jgi:carboxymethylenebutenolidase
MTYVSVVAQDGKEFKAYLAMPESDMPSPAVIVLQEIFGVNAGMREICDHLAGAGYIALCPDLFHRQEAGVELTDQTEGEWQKAFQLYQGFDVDKGVEDIKAVIDFVRAHESASGDVGAVGYCLGGLLAFLVSARTDIDCAVSYYGVGLPDKLAELAKVKKPLLLHIAELDKYVPAEARAAILAAAEQYPAVEAVVYEGVDHAFARPRGIHFNEAAAMRANMRTADFLAAHLLPEG